jgi:hypothetical protein
MTHISGLERSQLLLLPEAIDDYVVADNPVRFIDAFVDGLDLAAAGFKRVIVDQEVTNQVVDMGLLTQTAEPARAILEVETIDVVADRGYFKIEDIEACEKAGMTPYSQAATGIIGEQWLFPQG